MPRPPKDTTQICIRVPREWLEQADNLARLTSYPGFQLCRTDAFRIAIAKGMEALLPKSKKR